MKKYLQNVVKVWVVQGCLGRNTSNGIADEQVVEQLQALLVQVGAQRSGKVTLPLGERGLEVRIGSDTGPCVFIGCSEGSGDVSICIVGLKEDGLTGRS